MNILCIILKGIGDTIHSIPMLRVLKKQIKDSYITSIVSNNTTKDIIMASGCTDSAIIVEYNNIINIIKYSLSPVILRKKRYDISITTFPSNRIWYNIFAYLVGAPKRITHSYNTQSLRTLSFLQNIFVESKIGLHAVEQNIKLLEPLGIYHKIIYDDILIQLPISEKNYADNFLKQNSINEKKFIIGIHASIVSKRPCKNWSYEIIPSLALLIDWLYETFHSNILLFCGNDEKISTKEIFNLSKTKPLIVEQIPILKVAALISKCHLFINTDSGLGHIAAAVGVPTITIFGPAIPWMTRPYSEKSVVFENEIKCAPCYKYPFFYHKPIIRCKKNPECMKSINIERLKSVIINHIEKTYKNL